GGQNFRFFSPQNLEIRQYISVFRLQESKSFVSYKTASHLKKRKIRGFFNAKDAARLTPCKDNKP
ncbi:MAG: hypothetical protein IKF53_04650, partial [Clostridia bacterium]|nr:hypothetical protein [Clostridia bacterium]